MNGERSLTFMKKGKDFQASFDVFSQVKVLRQDFGQAKVEANTAYKETKNHRNTVMNKYI